MHQPQREFEFKPTVPSSGIVDPDGGGAEGEDPQRVDVGSRSAEDPMVRATSWRKNPWTAFAFRAAILGIVGYFLFLTLRNAWLQVESSGLEWDYREIQWWALVLSIPLGMLALLPPCFAWQRILLDFGQKVSWPDSFYAYFLGHFGKYVPGKAMAVLLRVGELHRHSVAARPAIVSVFIETLVGIATGAILGACLIAIVEVPSWIKIAAWVCIPFAMLALVPHTFRWVVHRIAKSRIGKMPPKIVEAIDGRMMFRMMFSCLVGWLFQGTALWCVLLAVSKACEPSLQKQLRVQDQLPQLLGGDIWSVHAWGVCVASISLGAFAGFVSMLPGGAVARELTSTWILSTIAAQPVALLATIVFRVTSITSEMTMIGLAKYVQWINRTSQS